MPNNKYIKEGDITNLNALKNKKKIKQILIMMNVQDSESKTNIRKKTIFFILSVAIMSYFFLETSSNFMLQVTAVIFWQSKKAAIIYGWLIFYLLLILIIPAFFSLVSLSRFNKIKLLTLIIIIVRVLALFYISGEIMLLYIILLFVSLLIYFTHILMLFRKVEYFRNIQNFIVGVVLGIGFNFTILSLNISSNLSYDALKIPFNIAFVGFLIFFGYYLFNSRFLINIQDAAERIRRPDHQEPMKILHFVFLGLLGFLAVSWIINPVGLSAYDSYIGEWFSYGFLFYKLVLLGSAILAFYLVQYTIDKLKFKQKRIFLLSNLLYLVLNAGAILFLENDTSIISTFYLMCMAIISLYILILDFSYLFSNYFLKSDKHGFTCQFVFMVSFALSYILLVGLTYYLYDTLLISISILFCITFLLIFLQEKNDFSPIISAFKRDNVKSKEYAIFFISIFLINLFSVSFMLYSFEYDETTNENPTIMVWNIHNGIGTDYKFDLDRIAEEIEETEPDILGLNEVDRGILKTGLIDIGAYLAEKLDMYYFYAPTYFKHYGIAILSKYPFESVKNIPLPRSPEINGEPRTLIQAKMQIGNKLWTVYVNHLSTKEEDRLLQVPFIVDLIKDYEFQRIIWMGDFNAQPHEKPYELVNSSSDNKFMDTHQYVNSNPEFTGGLDKNGNPTKRIDYIFCSPDLIPLKTKVHCSKASDHCAVITKF
ncbi:MAG: endonuclease/exonuclease/phosphatase family protein [Promethearchaeia archaeon]